MKDYLQSVNNAQRLFELLRMGMTFDSAYFDVYGHYPNGEQPKTGTIAPDYWIEPYSTKLLFK